MKFITKDIQALCKQGLDMKNSSYNVWPALLKLAEAIDKMRLELTPDNKLKED